MRVKERGRDGASGKFIGVDQARRQRGAIVERVKEGGRPTARKRGRDTETGEFIGVDEARRRGADAVVETVKRR